MSRACVLSVRSLSLVTLLAVFSFGCGDTSTEPSDALTIADLVGSWKASSVLLASKANPAQQFDIVAAGGELRVTILQHGGARSWLDLGDFSDEWDAQLTLNGNQLTSTPVESSRPIRQYTITLEGEQLIATSNDASFDFSLTGGNEVPATEVIVFQRQ